MIIGVPSGIGDISWAYSKLCNLEEKLEIEVADGWPYRSVPYLELLPRVKRATYGDFQYPQIIAQEQAFGINSRTTWYELKALGCERLLIEPNRHLEAGRRLEDWLPDLPCNFHYDMLTTDEDREKAEMILHGMPKPVFGISAASYRGSEAWKTWGFKEWKPFLEWLDAEIGGSVLLMGGFWDDLTSSLAECGYKDIVGKTTTGTMVELLKQMEGYIGFSSGLGILRTVLRKPVFMMWPDHQLELSRSWAPPHMLEDESYSMSLWRDNETVQRHVYRWLKAHYA